MLGNMIIIIKRKPDQVYVNGKLSYLYFLLHSVLFGKIGRARVLCFK